MKLQYILGGVGVAGVGLVFIAVGLCPPGELPESATYALRFMAWTLGILFVGGGVLHTIDQLLRADLKDYDSEY